MNYNVQQSSHKSLINGNSEKAITRVWGFNNVLFADLKHIILNAVQSKAMKERRFLDGYGLKNILALFDQTSKIENNYTEMNNLFAQHQVNVTQEAAYCIYDSLAIHFLVDTQQCFQLFDMVSNFTQGYLSQPYSLKQATAITI